MAKQDKNRNPFGKELKTINFDSIVLERLEKMAAKNETSVSNLVNFLCRNKVLNDIDFYREMQKYHASQAEKYRIEKEHAMQVQIVSE